MSSTRTYRLRWPTTLDAAACAATLRGCDTLPLSEAWRLGCPMEPVLTVAPGVSILGLVPVHQVDTPSFWEVRDGTLTFTAELLNPACLRAGDAVMPGEPSRESALFGELATTCLAEDGTVVGAWYAESLDEWLPVVWIRGMLLRGFVSGGWVPVPGRPGREHDGRLDVSGIVVDAADRTATIPLDAFLGVAA